MKVIVLFGPPGIGKGTIGALLSKRWNIPLVSIGDLLRENVKNNTEIGKKADFYMKKGELVPDEVVFEALSCKLDEQKNNKAILVDGFPRNLNQANLLESILKPEDRIILLNLVADDDLLIERLSLRRICKKCGAIYHLKNIPPKRDNICDYCNGELIQRDDDTPDVISRRLSVFRRETQPLIDYFGEKHRLLTISAEGGPEDILARIEQTGIWE